MSPPEAAIVLQVIRAPAVADALTDTQGTHRTKCGVSTLVALLSMLQLQHHLARKHQHPVHKHQHLGRKRRPLRNLRNLELEGRTTRR